MVDVGGGIGGMISEIVKSYPQIKGINFDLPHVIAKAPVHDGVSHIAGDMFNAIPNADAILLKVIFNFYSKTLRTDINLNIIHHAHIMVINSIYPYVRTVYFT